MTIDAAIRESGLPRLEAEVLAAFALGAERTWVVAHADDAIGPGRGDVERVFARRRGGEPVAYITGEREFFGRMFRVTPAVLIPRPATEELVRAALSFLDHPRDDVRTADAGIVIVSRVVRPQTRPVVIADIGTGSGCVAVTLALERPSQKVIATDNSADALRVARENAARFGIDDRVEFRLGDALAPLNGWDEPFLLVSNPPYIPEDAVLPQDVRREPASALFGGPDGADVIRALVAAARRHPACAGIVCECQADQERWLPSAFPGYGDD